MANPDQLKYEAIPVFGRERVDAAVRRNQPEELVYAVLSAALYSDQAEWAESICMQLAHHPDGKVRGNAVLGLGHIARLHQRLNRSSAQPVIEQALSDPDEFVRGQANSAASDVEHFLQWKIERDSRH